MSVECPEDSHSPKVARPPGARREHGLDAAKMCRTRTQAAIKVSDQMTGFGSVGIAVNEPGRSENNSHHRRGFRLRANNPIQIGTMVAGRIHMAWRAPHLMPTVTASAIQSHPRQSATFRTRNQRLSAASPGTT